MLSLFLTRHYVSEQEILWYQKRLREGVRVVISDDVRAAMLPVVEEVKRMLGIGLAHRQSEPSLNTSNPLSLSYFRKLHSYVSKRNALSLLLFHAWRSSLIAVLVLSTLSAYQGQPAHLWNPFAFGLTVIGVGYSFAALCLSQSDLTTQFKRSRLYLLSVLASFLIIYAINLPFWSLPLLGIHLSPFAIFFWASTMGILSAIRGDFDAGI